VEEEEDVVEAGSMITIVVAVFVDTARLFLGIIPV
jgi:hypothetical protein